MQMCQGFPLGWTEHRCTSSVTRLPLSHQGLDGRGERKRERKRGTEGKKGQRERKGRRGVRRRGGGGASDEPLATLFLPYRVIIVNLHNDNMRVLPSAPAHGQLCLGD